MHVAAIHNICMFLDKPLTSSENAHLSYMSYNLKDISLHEKMSKTLLKYIQHHSTHHNICLNINHVS